MGDKRSRGVAGNGFPAVTRRKTLLARRFEGRLTEAETMVPVPRCESIAMPVRPLNRRPSPVEVPVARRVSDNEIKGDL